MIISIVNQKGGVGKTTTTLCLGAALAEQGRKVLVVDLDPQRNATTFLHGSEYKGLSTNDMIYFAVRELPLDVSSFICYSDKEKLDYIPAVPDLASAPGILATGRDSNTVLSAILHLPYFSKYDYILLDCKPSLDLLVVNALVASHSLIVPVEPEDFAIDGLGDLLDTIGRVKGRYNNTLDINGVLISRANMARKKTRELTEQLRQTFGSMVYDTVIPNWAELGHAKDAGVTVLQVKGSSMGQLYRQLAEEVVIR